MQHYVCGILALNFFFKEINSFIQQECIKLIKSESKCIYDVYQLFFWTF